MQAKQDNYKQAKDDAPLKPVKRGGGACRSDTDCGGSLGRGACTNRGRCECASVLYTGPNCLVSYAQHNKLYATDQRFVVMCTARVCKHESSLNICV
jgi:uncharacterized 2Fe-2S/4Fe-4S cluster protein (DUF4445 family)